MRILYGVVGEGMGHATRSRVVLEHLTKHHDVHIVVSGRARDYLAKRFENVHNIWGFTIQYEGNSVKKWQTVLQNLKGAVAGWPQNVKKYFQIADEFRPDVVISDFESFSYLFARNHFIPCISIDNMQIINRCEHEPALLAGYEDQFELTKSIVKSKLPGAFHYLVTSFFQPKVRKERTSLVPSILRPEICAAKSEPGDHLLVYQTMAGNAVLVDELRKSGMECRIYGYRRDMTSEVRDGNLVFKPFSEPGFIEDLRTARGVIGGGGYTLMSEAVALRKPMLSVPVAGQFEQVLNALYLQKLNYGMHAAELNAQVLGEFLERIEGCSKSLAAVAQDGNAELFEKLDALLDQADGRKWDETTIG
jgi:uncharacterized protein (TIGR00661 family)